MPHSISRPFAASALALLALLAGDLFKIDPSVSAATRPTRLDYTMTSLPNGMQVVLLEDHSTPIVHAEVWYHVGSKNERPGRTGFAHLFEHMMFKGSKNVDPEGHPSGISSFDPLRNVYSHRGAKPVQKTVACVGA